MRSLSSSLDITTDEGLATPNSDRIKVLYIAGLGRNGGTLLDRILGQVNGFFSLGEFKFVWLKGLVRNELCNCGEPFLNCAFWNSVLDKAYGGMEELDGAYMHDLGEHVTRTRYVPILMSSFRPPQFTRRLEQYTQAMRRLYTAIRDESQCRVLVDSSKFTGYGMVLNEIDEIDLYVVHLVRDSRAVAYSWQKKKKKPEVTGEEAFIVRYSPLESAIRWSYSNYTAELLRRRSKNYQLLRYDDFVAEPKKTVQQLVQWLGEGERNPAVPFINDHTVVLGGSHTQSGNPMRFSHGELAIRLDDTWCTQLPDKDKRLVTRITKPGLSRYGFI